MAWENTGRAICTLALAMALGAGCGDDSGGGGGDDAPEGEKCSQPGFTQTGCACLTGAFGSRSCTAQGVWTDCMCPDPLEANECEFDGQKVVCMPYGACTEEWEVECVSNTFDCRCPAEVMQDGGMSSGGSGGGGGGSGGGGGMDLDAATDAASDPDADGG